MAVTSARAQVEWQRDASVMPAIRRAADLKRAVSKLDRAIIKTRGSRLDLCKSAIRNEAKLPTPLAVFFRDLTGDERYYWISILYTLLLEPRRRKRLATYFTPPHLCHHVIDRLIENGLDLSRHEILDPAAGGAAFLVPLSTRLREQLALTPQAAARRVKHQLCGYELEPGLAELSQMLLHAAVTAGGATTVGRVVRQLNTLTAELDRQFDAVVCNPPYGRVKRPSARLLARWGDVVTEGHVNAYALFIAACIERARAGGLIALVIPTSFIGGPYFAALRRHILRETEVVALDIIEKRSDLFIDVVQDTCVLILRKRCPAASPCRATVPTASIIGPDGRVEEKGSLLLPAADDSTAWVLPGDVADESEFFDARLATLETYGYQAKTGYFVWNRSRDKLKSGSQLPAGHLPLIWAHCIQPDRSIRLSSGPKRKLNDQEISGVNIDRNSSAVLTTRSVVLQRTTNRGQRRRLVTGAVTDELVSKYGGYVTENHTIVVFPLPDAEQLVSVDELAALLGSAPVDRRFRRISGTVSVSTKMLRHLPLPDPGALRACIASHADFEEAVDAAYLLSLEADERPNARPPEVQEGQLT